MVNVDEPDGAQHRAPSGSAAFGKSTDAPKAPIVAVRDIFKRFWPYARPYKWFIVVALLLGLLLPVLQGATIWMFKVLTDRVLVPKDINAFWPVAGIYAAITIGVGLVTFTSSYLSRWLAQHFSLDLRTAVFAHLHSLSIEVIDSRRLGDLLSRLTNDVTAVRRLVVSGITRTLSSLARVVLFTGDRKSTRLNSSHVAISYAVFCLKKKIMRQLLHG